jgi:tetratricopeptide (TPR) repeat protein
MRRFLPLLVAVVAAAMAAVVAYQVVARDREYQQLLARGDAALVEDQTFVAIEAYSGAVALRPDSMLARLRRGETYQRRGELEAAARDFRIAAALDQAAPRPLEGLGNVLYQMQRYARAADAYESALALDDRSPRLSHKLALARYRAGELDAAVTAATRAAQLGPANPEAAYLLGLCLRARRRNAEAQRAFEHAVALSPGFIAAREELADLYSAQNRRTDELDQLQIMAGLDRDHAERQIAVGMAQARAGHAEAAVLALGTALERTPDPPLVYEALGRVWLDDAELRDDSTALNKSLEALERVGSGPAATSAALTLFGRALLRDGQVERAEQTLQQATTRFPVEPSAFLYYANAAERQNHLDAARRALVDYSSLVADDAQSAVRAARIASLSIRLDDAATAVRWLERAVAASPSDVRLLTSLADAQLRSGSRDAARATVERGLALDPQQPALQALARRVRPPVPSPSPDR